MIKLPLSSGSFPSLSFVGAILMWMASQLVVEGANPQTCVTSFDSTTDYFPDKVSVELAERFDVEYGLNYKIVTTVLTAATSWAPEVPPRRYLLVQCGTPVPADLNIADFDNVFQIPLQEDSLQLGFGNHYSTYVPFFELLGLRNEISIQAGQPDYFFSPCFNELVDNGAVPLISSISNATVVSASGVDTATPFFVGVGSSTVFENPIEVSEWYEVTNLAVFEWLKYFSVFFNKEKEATDIFDATRRRYECATDNAGLVVADLPAPKTVAWVAYWGDAFRPATCPNYYCELAQACGVNLISTDGSGINVTEFVELAKDADALLYNGGDLETTLNKYPELQELKAVKNNELYDIMGLGQDAWFNERKVEPDALLEDFCHISGTSSILVEPHVPTFLRHIDTPIRTFGECTDEFRSMDYLKLGSFCEPLPLGVHYMAPPTPSPPTAPPTPSPPSTAPPTPSPEVSSNAFLAATGWWMAATTCMSCLMALTVLV